MKTVKQRIQKRRKFTEEFKRHIVREFESGKFSVKELSLLYGLSFTSIYKWIYKYSTTHEKEYQIVELKNSSYMKVKELKEKIKNLEQLLGQERVKNAYLEKLIDIAEERMNIDIKKNANLKPSDGLSKTKKKGGSR